MSAVDSLLLVTRESIVHRRANSVEDARHEPLRLGRYVNICVEHTDYRPLPLQAVVRLAAELVDGRTPAGETTIERLRAIGALG